MVLLARDSDQPTAAGSTTDTAARVSRRADAVTVALSTWFVVGLFVDAWAHNNRAELETFFTPWHGLFYSGFVAVAAWVSWLILQNLRAGRRGRAAVPVGYGLAVLGVPAFAVSALGDLGWHTTFGIETSLDILFSPTHLGLAASMALIVTSPFRSAWARPDTGAAPTLRRLWPAVLSLSLATTLVLLFAQYANALVWWPEGVVQALSNPMANGARRTGPQPSALAASIIVTNVALLVPLLLTARRWRPPFGTASVLYVTVAVLVGAVTAFAFPAILLGIVVSGVCVDALLAWLRPGPGRRDAFLAFAGLTALVTWAVYLAASAMVVGRLPAVVEYWTGLPVVAALHGLVLGALAAPHSGIPAGPDASEAPQASAVSASSAAGRPPRDPDEE
jgi:hypothetical protein